MNGFFDNRGKKSDFLLGPNSEKEVDIIGYEFYQVIFENQKNLKYQTPPALEDFLLDK